MKFTQKYAIVCLLENLEEGIKFSSSNWPLHVTLADTFAIELSTEQLQAKLAEIASKLEPVVTKATGDEYFGPDQNVHVVLLNKTDELVSLHNHIVNSLEAGSVIFNDPQYTKDGFVPHSTIQKHARVSIGNEVTLNNIALIDMFPERNPYSRKILGIFDI